MNESLKFAVEIAPMTLIIGAGVASFFIMFGIFSAGLKARVAELSKVIKHKDFSFAPKHSENNGSLMWAKPCWANGFTQFDV